MYCFLCFLGLLYLFSCKSFYVKINMLVSLYLYVFLLMLHFQNIHNILKTFELFIAGGIHCIINLFCKIVLTIMTS
jgi:hypothetical protein